MRAGGSALIDVIGVVAATQAFAHGGVSIEEDTCVMQIGPYLAHFTGYQPTMRASQEFCEDISMVADAIVVLDFINAPLREMAVDFRVVEDVNDIGITATYADLGTAAEIEAATMFYEKPQHYPRGNINVNLTFAEPGDFIGVVTASDVKTDQSYFSVFPFSVGKTRRFAGFGWIIAPIVFGLALYFLTVKRAGANGDAMQSS